MILLAGRLRALWMIVLLLSCTGTDGSGQIRNIADTLRIIFAGDIMGHDTQIESAYDSTTNTYQYEDVFREVSPILKNADYAVANLECTLAGPPYTGYPRFSSPDELAAACLKNGINVLMTANNHSCDRGKTGITRTISVLDILGIQHTGTFYNPAHRDTSNLLILNKGNLAVGILNYTYGTNGLPIPAPAMVNLIDTAMILSDINDAWSGNIDKLIVMLHWGKEYQSEPSSHQKMLADFLFSHGVDVIIGSHPHVIQPMAYQPETTKQEEQLAVYSLGNFVSNQRKTGTDGGAMVALTFIKMNDTTKLSDYGYHLTWVRKYMDNGKWQFRILPAGKAEGHYMKSLDTYSQNKLNTFLTNTHKLLQEKNIRVREL